MVKLLRELSEWIGYQRYCFKLWFHEFRLKLMGVDRSFYCQRQEEFETKCVNQCDHCKIYYAPLEELKKDEKRRSARNT